MNRYLICLVLLSLSLLPMRAGAQDDFEPKRVRQPVGWIEKIRLSPGDLLMYARLDPGRSTSTLYAENFKKMRKNKKLWVSFDLNDRYGTSVRIQREIIRSAKVKGADGKSREEHTVSLGMCLGRAYFEDEVRLIDKKHEEFDLRLGRQALEGNVLIDPATKLTTTPECGERGKDLGPVETLAKSADEGAGGEAGGGAE